MGVYSNEGDIDASGSERVNLRTAAGVELLGQQVSAASLPVVFASDQVAIPVTITNAAQSGNRYSIVRLGHNFAPANTEETALLVKNPIGSGKNIQIQLLGLNNKTKTQTAEFFVYANPTITSNGTAMTPRNLTIGSLNTSGMQIFHTPVTSSFGTLLHVFGTGANQNDLTRLLDATDIILPGNNYLVTGSGSNNNTQVEISLEWTEA